VPEADVSGFVGRSTCFEVTVNDTVIHSKLKTMRFPDFDEVVEIVKKTFESGEAPELVTKHQSLCNIL